jgi:hypothetical protein
MLDDMIETIGPACPWREDALAKALSEDLAATEDSITTKSPDEDLKLDAPATERQVLCLSPIPALDPSRMGATARAVPSVRNGSGPNDNAIALYRHTVHEQT